MWLHVPKSLLSESSPSSPVAAGSISASSKRRKDELVLWSTSSGKPTQRPLSWRGWRNRPWLKLLSGTTSAPSTLERGVEQWISLLAARPVRTSASPARRQGSKANAAASSFSTSASQTSQERPGSSGRTWAGPQAELFGASSTLSSRKASGAPPSPFVLLTWGRLNGASGSSSWPTATTRDAHSSARSTTTAEASHTGTTLLDATKEWATPAASLINYEETPESFRARSERLVSQGTRPLGANLGQEAKLWHAPLASETTGGHEGRRDLRTDVANWSTPQARDPKGKAGGDFNHNNLNRDVAQWQWQTPRASDPEKGGPNQSLKGKPALTAQARLAQWPTAAATDYKGASREGQRRGQLGEAILKHGRPVQETEKVGSGTSPTAAPLRLNPDFVEALMGWPRGWSMPIVRPKTFCGPID